MKKIILLLSLFVIPLILKAEYHKARIYFDKNFDINKANNFGIDFESANIKEGLWADVYIDDFELKELQESNVKVEILARNIEEFYQRRFIESQKDIDKIQNEKFELGSYGGYFKLEENYQKIDKIMLEFPELISKRIIGYSLENRPIYLYAIGPWKDSATIQEQVLYTGIHHAREPGGVRAIIYFLDNLFEKFRQNDPEAEFLLSNKIIYVVPVLNPDGYMINQKNFPSGGGMWRKNARRVNSVVKGVDLNRNYGPMEYWDYPVEGSSTNPDHGTYRGEAPFSEPETAALRDFCYDHNIKIAVNYHTYGNLIINPYSFSTLETPDSNFFINLGLEISSKNDYVFGAGAKAVGYPSRGDADDWFYWDGDKEKVLAITPEAGHNADGFWPALNRIEEICKDNLPLCYQYLWSSGINLRPTEVKFDPKTQKVELTVKNIGIKDIDAFSTVTVKSLNPYIELNQSYDILALKAGEMQKFIINPVYQKNYINGQPLEFEVIINQNEVLRLDTFRIPVGFKIEEVKLYNEDKGLGDWFLNMWGTEYNDLTQEVYLSDSPYSPYSPQADNYLEYGQEIDLRGFNYAELLINSKWSVEHTFDGAIVQASTDGGETWNFLSSERTVKGRTISQSRQSDSTLCLQGNIPVFIDQHFSLEDYIGKNILLRLGLISDNASEFDGWFIRDISLLIYPDAVVSVSDEDNLKINLYPNPATANSIVTISSPKKRISAIKVYDIAGNVVHEGLQSTFKLNITPGIYIVRIMLEDKVIIKKLQIFP